MLNWLIMVLTKLFCQYVSLWSAVFSRENFGWPFISHARQWANGSLNIAHNVTIADELNYSLVSMLSYLLGKVTRESAYFCVRSPQGRIPQFHLLTKYIHCAHRYGQGALWLAVINNRKNPRSFNITIQMFRSYTSHPGPFINSFDRYNSSCTWNAQSHSIHFCSYISGCWVTLKKPWRTCRWPVS